MTAMQANVGGAAAGFGTGAPGLMERLKHETRELHTRAERGDIQKALVTGRATRAQYAAWLGQMSLLHGAVEQAIERLRAGDGGAVFDAIGVEWTQARLGREDLASLEMSGEGMRALPATARIEAEIAACASPLRALGFFYVLEGANNGNRFIVRAVRKGLGLTPGTGDRFLDPYGDEQPAVWAGVKARLDSLGASLSAAEQDEVVAGAARMFGMVIEIGDALAVAHPVA